MSLEAFQAALLPLRHFIQTLDPNDPTTSQEKLAKRYPLNSDEIQNIAKQFVLGCDEGWLCHKEAGGIHFSRVYKNQNENECAIDAVKMSGKGPGHTHPNGEFDLCLPTSGEPKFDGQKSAWVVYPPNSWHEPTVSSGSMNILYFLPNGAIRFERESTAL